jgi:hypothetical protein
LLLFKKEGGRMKASKIFFHDVRCGYPEGVLDGILGIPEYTARVLASTDQDDVVIVPHQVVPHLEWINAHYERVGLGVARTVIMGDWDTIDLVHGHQLSVFIFTEEAQAVRPDERRLQAVSEHNDKNHFIRVVCGNLGISIPKTFCFNSPDDVRALPLPYPFYVKAAVSASGQRVNRCGNDKELELALREVAGCALQIQEELPAETIFLNVQYRNEGGRAVRGPVTRQILDGNSHNGNIYPSGVDEKIVWSVTDRLAHYGAAAGLQEIWAYDVAYLPDGEVQVLECNPRFNGCTYFSNVAARLNVSAWSARNVKFYPGKFEGLDFDGLEYTDGRGIVVVNWGCAHHRKLGLFVAGTEVEQASYLSEFEARFNRRPQMYAVR